MASFNDLMSKVRSERVELCGASGECIRVGFRDRDGEIGWLFKTITREGRDGIAHVSIIYGPKGCGKTTLAKVFANAVNELSSEANVVYAELEEDVVRAFVPGMGISEVLFRLGELAADYIHPPVRIVVNAVKFVFNMFRVHRVEGKDLVIVLDEFDRRVLEGLRYSRPRDLAEGIAKFCQNRTSEGFGRGYLDVGGIRLRSLWVVLQMSDHAVMSDIMSVGGLVGKGGLGYFLTWNLPRDSFLGLVREVAEQTNAAHVDEELVWQLTGGNVRALAELALDHGWNMDTWVNDALRRIRRELVDPVVGDYNVFSDYSEYVRKLARRGVGPDNAILAINAHEVAFKANVLISVGGVRRISQLPNEPWIGEDYAYQLPIYYWALRAMVKRGTVNVTPGDVINEVTVSTE